MKGPVAARLLARCILVASLGAGCGLQPHPTAGSSDLGGSPSGGGDFSGSAGSSGSGASGSSGSGANNGTGNNTGFGGSGGNPSNGTGAAGKGGATGAAGSVGTGGNQGGSAGTTGAAGTGSGGAGSGAAGMGGTGAVSNVGVTINGKFVPKEKAVVFIHFGHSNMRGQATKPASLMSYFYNTQDGLWTYRGSFAAAKEPTAPEGTMTFAGPGMAILRSAQAALKPGSDVQFISIGFGRGSSTTVDYATTGSFYPTFMAWAKALKGKVTFGGIVVMLGITDGEHLPSAQVPGFPMRMAQILASIRSDLDEPNLPVLFCDYEQNATGDLAPTGSVGMVMEPLVRMLPSMVTNLALIPTDGLEMQDDHHFDMQGHKDWGGRVISTMQSKGWFPW